MAIFLFCSERVQTIDELHFVRNDNCSYSPFQGLINTTSSVIHGNHPSYLKHLMRARISSVARDPFGALLTIPVATLDCSS